MKYSSAMKLKACLLVVVSSSTLFLSMPLAPLSAASSGQKCSKAGTLSGTKSAPLVCAKVGGKLVWQYSKKVVAPATTKETVSQSNARKSAKNYLSLMAFSRDSLIRQLEFEKYSTSDATYGADAQNADWNAQAAKSASAYLKLMSFSRASLITQLVFEGFTQSQAEFGVSTTGL